MNNRPMIEPLLSMRPSDHEARIRYEERRTRQMEEEVRRMRMRLDAGLARLAVLEVRR